MALTLNQAMTRLRRLITEKTAAFSTDAELFDEISDAQQEASKELDAVVNITTFALSDGVESYTLPTGTQRVLFAWWVDRSNRWPITMSDDTDAEVMLGNKQLTENRSQIMIRTGFDTVEMRPVPSADKTCRIRRTKEADAISLSADTFELRDSHVKSIVLPRAAQRVAERYGDPAAGNFERQYEMGIEKAKKELARWAVQGRPRNQYHPGQFDDINSQRHPLAGTLV